MTTLDCKTLVHFSIVAGVYCKFKTPDHETAEQGKPRRSLPKSEPAEQPDRSDCVQTALHIPQSRHDGSPFGQLTEERQKK